MAKRSASSAASRFRISLLPRDTGSPLDLLECGGSPPLCYLQSSASWPGE